MVALCPVFCRLLGYAVPVRLLGAAVVLPSGSCARYRETVLFCYIALRRICAICVCVVPGGSSVRLGETHRGAQGGYIIRASWRADRGHGSSPLPLALTLLYIRHTVHTNIRHTAHTNAARSRKESALPPPLVATEPTAHATHWAHGRQQQEGPPRDHMCRSGLRLPPPRPYAALTPVVAPLTPSVVQRYTLAAAPKVQAGPTRSSSTRQRNDFHSRHSSAAPHSARGRRPPRPRRRRPRVGPGPGPAPPPFSHGGASQ